MGKESLSLEEREKAKVLHVEGRSYHSIAMELKRSPHTIKKYLVEPATEEQIEEIKEELSDIYEGLARRMIDSIEDSEIKKLNPYQRTVASGIATDKMRLLRGQATQIVDAFRVAIERIEAKFSIGKEVQDHLDNGNDEGEVAKGRE